MPGDLKMFKGSAAARLRAPCAQGVVWSQTLPNALSDAVRRQARPRGAVMGLRRGTSLRAIAWAA
jgi:hypothetical protein